MSIIRIIQESDLIKNNSMFSLKALNSELDNMEEIIKEKDVIISNNQEKIQDLESQNLDLERTLQEVLQTQQLQKEETATKTEYYNVMLNYEKFIHKITADYEIIREQRNTANNHLACLEVAFADLLLKYERLKTIVVGFQENETVMKDYFRTHYDEIDLIQKKYDDLKRYTDDKLKNANIHIATVDKTHISEMAEVKAQLQQENAKNNELEKIISNIKASYQTNNGKSLIPSIINTFKLY